MTFADRKGGFPHSEIFGSKGARASPKLIAACHVLHRLSTPRHPSEALMRLIVLSKAHDSVTSLDASLTHFVSQTMMSSLEPTLPSLAARVSPSIHDESHPTPAQRRSGAETFIRPRRRRPAWWSQ